MKTTQKKKKNNNDAEEEEEEEEVSGEAAYGQTTHLWSSVKVLSIIVGCASSFFLSFSKGLLSFNKKKLTRPHHFLSLSLSSL
tara:strand:+ start:4235 stop:4483 length:249 start_codon:yes stop_codon:yes gene_type:complete